ncbi:MAG: hypothetical protein Q9168_001231 [Polycauliona sp. 1 TL-2023]
MAPVDPAVASVLDTHPPNDYSDEDELLDALDDDPALDSFREQRLQQLHEEFNKAKHLRNQEHGSYTEINNEKALMDIVNTGAESCLVHFFKPDFHRCGTMSRHLDALAPLHFETRFLCINVENAPFLVTKLKVQVLPCVIAFKKGLSVDRIIGFEGLGYTEHSFSTQDLERRLLQSGSLVRPKVSQGHEAASLPGNHTISGSRGRGAKADDDDDDWD